MQGEVRKANQRKTIMNVKKYTSEGVNLIKICAAHTKDMNRD